VDSAFKKFLGTSTGIVGTYRTYATGTDLLHQLIIHCQQFSLELGAEASVPYMLCNLIINLELLIY
jgi:hypothetical protein